MFLLTELEPDPALSHPPNSSNSKLSTSHAIQYHGASVLDNYGRSNIQYTWRCLVCSKSTCQLRSHRQYMNRVMKHTSHDLQTFYQSYPKPFNLLPQELATTKVDPFGHFPIDMSVELDDIYRYFYLPWTTSSPPGPQRHLFPISRYHAAMEVAQHDKTLFVGLISLVATQLSKIRTRSINETALKLQVLAASLQREACIRDGPSDARILTTICVMSNHIAGGELDKLVPHMNMANSLIRQRGGLEKLGMRGVVADNVMYGDWTKAVSHNNPPYYKMPLPAIQPPQIPASTAATAFSNLPISHGVLIAARDLSVLMQIYNLACKDQATSSQKTYFAYLANVVEFTQAELNFALHTDPTSLDYCLVLAFIMTNAIVLRNYASVNPVFYAIEERYWKCFEIIRAEKKALPVDLELWLIFTGCLVSVRGPSRFEGRAVDILSEMILNRKVPSDFSFVANIFDTFIWCAPVQLFSYHALWSRALRRTLESDPITPPNRSQDHVQ